jgi:hypothetical protein
MRKITVLLIVLFSLTGILPVQAYVRQGLYNPAFSSTLIACNDTGGDKITITWPFNRCWKAVYDYRLPANYNGQTLTSAPPTYIATGACGGPGNSPPSLPTERVTFTQEDPSHIYVNSTSGGVRYTYVSIPPIDACK